MNDCWGYAKEKDPDRFEGMLPSREEAIRAGREAYGERATFYIASGSVPSPLQFVPAASTILDLIATAAYDESGEVVEDFPDVDEAAEKELDDLLHAWAEKHLGAPGFWIGDGRVERVSPEPEPGTHEAAAPEVSMQATGLVVGEGELEPIVDEPPCTCHPEARHVDPGCLRHGPF